MNDNEQLDKILDEALNEYREVEPLAGLEDRVLQRLRLPLEDRRSSWWKWGVVAACAGLVLIAVWIEIGSKQLRNSPRNQPTAQQHATQVPISRPEGNETNAGKQPPRKQIAAQRLYTPGKVLQAAHNADEQAARLEPTRVSGSAASQFPLPAALTPEEYALLALARSNPDALLNQTDRSRDLEIAPIEIKPLAGRAEPAQENSNE